MASIARRSFPSCKRLASALGPFVAATVLVACGSSSTTTSTSSSSGSTSTSSASTSTSSISASSNPSTFFGTTNISGLGNVVVDGRGRTVYILTSTSHTNVLCTSSNGCTAVWPALPLPAGKTGAKAGSGVNQSLLGTLTAGGKLYPTYNGWLMYEFSGDSGSGQAKGQAITSFGGTWYVLNAAGNPVVSAASSGGAY